MLAEAPSAAAEILLLEQNSEQVALFAQAVNSTRLTVVQDCPKILQFLRHEGPHTDAQRPDLILLDLELSDPEGCAMLSDIKRDPQLRRIPVIVLATSDSYEHVSTAYDLHANAYICKPETSDLFIQTLRATLHFWLALARLPRE